MISDKALTQEDIDKIIKETEQQIANEPVYTKPIKEDVDNFKPLTTEELDNLIVKQEEQVENEPVYVKPIKENTELVVLGYNTETKTLEKGILTNNV